MTSAFEYPSPRSYAETILQNSKQALAEAVAIVSPDNPEADPLTVFPAPTEVRDQGQGLELTEEQANDLRAAVAPLGFERPTDVSLSELGLVKAHVIIEGGQPHKMVAEAQMVMEDGLAEPASLIFSASPYVKLDSDGMKASAQRQFGTVPETEYDAARLVAENLPGFRPLENDLALAIGYDINNEYAVTGESDGQLVMIGNIVTGESSTPVLMFRVDREYYKDNSGKSKYRQPGAGQVMRIVSEMSGFLGDSESPIAFVTSGTYQPSRQVDAAALSLQTNRLIGVATYGTDRLLAVNGELPAPKRLNQLPGELHVMASHAQKLEELLAQS